MLATPDLIPEATQASQLKAAALRARHVPLYSEYKIAEQNLDFPSLPLITKRDIGHNFPANFLKDPDCLATLLQSGAAELEHTSGTSNERTPLLLPAGWWQEQELHALQLNSFISGVLGADPAAKRVTITSPSCNGDVSYAGTPSCQDRVVGNTLYVALSRLPFLWGPQDLERMTREALAWDPIFLDLDPVYGCVFARYCEQEKISFPNLKFIICSYEYLSTLHRHLLERVFKVPVFNLYGSTETGHLLMETTDGTLQPVLETAAIELLNVDQHGRGDLVVTTLTNPLMPLLRYSIGDLVSRQPHACGTTYVLHGRSADAFLLGNGSRTTVKDIEECFARLTGVMHYQLRQKASPGDFELRWIPDPGAPQPDIMLLAGSLRETLDEATVRVTKTELLLPENSGKFRLCVPKKRDDSATPCRG